MQKLNVMLPPLIDPFNSDTVQSSVSFSLGDNIENLILAGAGNTTGIGNALDNTLIGNGAANTLDGGAGADTIGGGTGNCYVNSKLRATTRRVTPSLTRPALPLAACIYR